MTKSSKPKIKPKYDPHKPWLKKMKVREPNPANDKIPWVGGLEDLEVIYIDKIK